MGHIGLRTTIAQNQMENSLQKDMETEDCVDVKYMDCGMWKPE